MSYYSFESNTQSVKGTFVDAVNSVNRAVIIGDVPLLNYDMTGTVYSRIKGDRLNFQGQSFDAVKRYLSLPLTTPSTQNISISFWLKPNLAFINVKTDQTIIKRTSVFEIMVVGSANTTEKQIIKVKVFNKATSQYETVNQTYFGNSTNWKQITWTYNGAGVAPFVSSLWIDGVLTNTKTFTEQKPLNAQPNDATQKFTVSDVETAKKNLNAQVDELKIYDRAISINRITSNISGTNCQKSGLDPYNATGLDYCTQKSETDQERIACMRQSCRAKQQLIMAEFGTDFFAIADDFCANPLRATASENASALNIVNNCVITKTPSSNNCLLSMARDLTVYDQKVNSVCNLINPGNPTTSYKCYISSKYGTFNITNTFANCGNINNETTASECIYYLSKSDTSGTLYASRVDQIIKTFGYQAKSITYNQPTFASKAAAEQYAKYGIVSSGEKSDTGDLIKDILGKYWIGGECLKTTDMGILQYDFADGTTYAGLKIGNLGDCKAVCRKATNGYQNSPLIGQICSDLFSQHKPVNKIFLNDNAQEVVASCLDFKPGDLLDKCYFMPLCSLAGAACDSAVGCKVSHPVCNTCAIMVPTAVKGTNFFKSSVTINGVTQEVTGTKDFLQRLAMLLDKMLCQIPVGCTISQSQAGVGTTNHEGGKAIDFCCDGASNPTEASKKLIENIGSGNSDSKLDVISECTESEKKCAGTTNCKCLVHLDSDTGGVPNLFKDMQVCKDQSTNADKTCKQAGCDNGGGSRPCCSWPGRGI
jgi:hypothetical protein